MPSTSESTQASNWPPGRSTRLISAARSSAISCRGQRAVLGDHPVRAAVGQERQAAGSATTGMIRPGRPAARAPGAARAYGAGPPVRAWR